MTPHRHQTGQGTYSTSGISKRGKPRGEQDGIPRTSEESHEESKMMARWKPSPPLQK
ncbi:Hypothetical predicted protein, partial [Pelobates cultripes]